ncbi:MAG: alpha-glucosidase [Lachnospiraceae bacterium]|nr:alpha-glucosidase [Lachnospiraceae bacterium]
MIKKFTYGKPIQTEAVVKELTPESSRLPYFDVRDNAEGEHTCSLVYPMKEEDIVYGLGESVRGINKRGFLYKSKCNDDPVHQESTNSLYGAHNFIIISGSVCFGLFVDFPGEVVWDIGYTSLHELVITPCEPDFDLYLIEGADEKAIAKEFRQLTGRSYIAPKWAFGYAQSRWSYMNAEEVREVVKEHRENGIPLDSVVMDIDYMERYKDFTINEAAFPKFAEFVEEMARQGIHLVPIIDAGVKREEGYDVYEEGLQNHYFCKKEDGSNFVAGVWPGKVCFPDMLNDDARRWFGRKYKLLLDQGIEGFWNDMNEPAIFYSEDHLKEVFEELGKMKDRELDIYEFFHFKDLVLGVANNDQDYASFYHDYKGETIRHDRVHNLYGYYMTRSAAEAFEELVPDKRILLYSRASYIGMHRYGGIWTGDNMSWWSHLLMNIRMMPSLNMCGFLYTGADLGGFGADTTEDLVLRWLAFGIFTPIMRNHSALGTRRQEAYRFESKKIMADIISIRYALLPYLYSEYMKAALEDGMMFRPLAFDYREDTFARRVEDQLLCGDSIMLTPVYEQNAKGRYVYLPEDMKLVRMKSADTYETEVLPKGHHYIDIALDEVVFFIRKNKCLPLAKGAQCIGELDFADLKLLGYVTEKAEYDYYMDDGYSKDYDNPAYRMKFEMERQAVTL